MNDARDKINENVNKFIPLFLYVTIATLFYDDRICNIKRFDFLLRENKNIIIQ